ncbi:MULTISPECIES: radical SAM protein [Anaerostipes]|uniref:Radical SAM protein n=1 Tax=Anaerostipes butyraticus TaxID=645466 RepID=A0A916Q5Z6_9FIRM|nr:MULTISPECIES: radical SAM protein [Anaerostipes]GFO85033.1 radical SAM protein [Anaerostipes butyraticus]
MKYEGIVYRPPSEAYSLIVQVTIGCSQNHCAFCSMYKTKQFRIRSTDEIIDDFMEAREMYPKIEKIFLADGDALICPVQDLEMILKLIRKKFPECRQVTCYASPKSILLKKTDELKRLCQLGLSMVYMGLESGSDKVLEYMKKGADSKEMIKAAEKIHNAGIRLSVTAISGLGGKKWWKEHAVETGKVLSEMKPEYAGLLTLMIEEGVPLEQEIKSGRFQLMNPYEILIETREMLEHMDCPGCIFRSNHASNYISLRGTLNKDKEKLIKQLDQAVSGSAHLKSEWMRML